MCAEHGHADAAGAGHAGVHDGVAAVPKPGSQVRGKSSLVPGAAAPEASYILISDGGINGCGSGSGPGGRGNPANEGRTQK